MTRNDLPWYIGHMTDMHWYILSVKSTEDFQVEAKLLEQGLFAISFISEKTTIHRRTKKKLTRVTPLFPSYVFVQCSPDDWAGIKGTAGVSRFLSAADHMDEDKTPLAIDPYVVYALLTKERSGAFRAGKNAAVDLGDVIMCEALGQMVQATVTKSNSEGATLEATINGMRIVMTKTVDELRAA